MAAPVAEMSLTIFARPSAIFTEPSGHCQRRRQFGIASDGEVLQRAFGLADQFEKGILLDRRLSPPLVWITAER